MPFNIPNALTWLRIVMIPVFVGVFYLPDAWVAGIDRNLTATALFVAAAVTDWLDGYLARSLNQQSAFGAFLDPVADKLMVAAALVLLVDLERVHAVVALIIVGREIAISALREWMAQLGAARSVAVSFIGKVKTASQLTAIPLLLYHDPVAGLDPQAIGTALVLVAAFLTLLSMIYYLKLATPHLSR